MHNKLLNFSLILSTTFSLGCDLNTGRSTASSSTPSGTGSGSGSSAASTLITDFKSADRAFSEAKGPGHSEIVDTFMVLTNTIPNHDFNNISFKFTANTNEVAFNGNTPTKAGTPYAFSYTATDLDADTILIKLKGTTPMSGKVFMVDNVDVVKPFERATLMYQKSKNQLLFLIIYKQADEAKFSVHKPTDFIIDPPAGADLKDRSEPHAAFILKP